MPDFWILFERLPSEVKIAAKRKFVVLKSNPQHPSLHLKKINSIWSVRVTLNYRALAAETENTRVWFWIGSHADYDRLISS